MSVEVYVAGINPRGSDGVELHMAVRGVELQGAVIARLSAGGSVNEVWIGDEVWNDSIDRNPRLVNVPGVVGSIARKAQEFGLILRVAVPQRRAA